jgi:hypothetical protein
LIRRPSLLIAVVLLAAACAGGGGGGGGGKGGGGAKGCKCDPPGCPTVSFNGNIQPIFNRSCATSSQCHGPNGAQNLDLTTGNSIRNTVGVKATQQPRKLLIKAGDPGVSYLFQKITGLGGISGILMPQGCPGPPLGGAVCLSMDDSSAIEEWITQCATATPSLP